MKLNTVDGSRMLTSTMTRYHLWKIAGMIIGAAGLLAEGVEACPACKTLLLAGDSQAANASGVGMYWSILLLLAVPCALVGGMAWIIARAIRRQSTLMTRRASTVDGAADGA